MQQFGKGVRINRHAGDRDSADTDTRVFSAREANIRSFKDRFQLVVMQALQRHVFRKTISVSILRNIPASRILPFVELGDIVVLAVEGTAAENAVKLAGITNLKGKTVIDATNPITDAPPVNGVLQCFTSRTMRSTP